MPYIQKEPFKLDNVMICRDCSRAATRAVAYAIPILGKGGRVEIVIVTNAASNMTSRALISTSISLLRPKWSTGFLAAISMAPTRYCRMAPTASPTSW